MLKFKIYEGNVHNEVVTAVICIWTSFSDFHNASKAVSPSALS